MSGDTIGKSLTLCSIEKVVKVTAETGYYLVDNSEFMRNGDYVPNRLEAQRDAANLVCGTKTQANRESTVGLLKLAGKGPELLASPTDDMGKLLNCLHDVPIEGTAHVASGVQIAQLALKHRRNKHGKQCIILFIGSPVIDDVKALVKVGKLLKKNNVALDVVSMGEVEDNKQKLQEFVDAANSADNSHMITIPAGILPSDVLISSPIINEGGGTGAEMGGMAAVAAASGTGADRGGGDTGGIEGVDASLDPELALALRVSMEEERARQEAAAASALSVTDDKGEESKDKAATDTGAIISSDTTAVASAVVEGTDAELNEEALVKQALAMSMSEVSAGAPDGIEDPEEYAAMQVALQMSLNEDDDNEVPALPKSPTAGVPQPAASAAPGEILDQSFVQELLGQLEGIDPNDPRIKAAMKKIGTDSTESGADKKEDGSDKKDKEKE